MSRKTSGKGGFSVRWETSMFTDFDFDAVIKLGKAQYSTKAFLGAVYALQEEGIILMLFHVL